MSNKTSGTEATKWDRFSILAEVKRRGMSLVSISMEAGLYGAAARQGLHGTSLPGAEAIASALDIPFRELFQREKGFYPSYERRIAKRNRYQSDKKGSELEAPVDNTERAA